MSDNKQHFLSGNGNDPSRVLNADDCLYSEKKSLLNPGDVQHAQYLSDNIGALYLNENFADVTLVVDGERLPAHRVILAARSDYFRALLFGGLKESAQTEIELKNDFVTLLAFKLLLRYVYTGRIALYRLKEDVILDVLGLTHKYGFDQLEVAIIDYLKTILDDTNLCQILSAAQMFSLQRLLDFCLHYADRNADRVLANTDAFCQLPAAVVCQLISRDSFCAREIDIFQALHRWALHNACLQQTDGQASVNGDNRSGDSTGTTARQEEMNPASSSDRHHSALPSSSSSTTAAAADDDWRQILMHIRWPLMKLDELLTVVRPTGLIAADVILDAIKEQTEKRGTDLPYRGFSLPDENAARPELNAQVIEGELKQALLNGDSINYDMERGFTRHPIEDGTKGIVVQLGAPYIINHIRLLLWDKDQRSYSYFVEVSVDQQDWVRVVDYSRYLCRSWQRLYFTPRVVRFVRVMGTHNTINRVFHLVTLEAYLSTERVEFDPGSGVILPHENVASIDKHCVVISGVSRTRNALINGDTTHYDWDSGYTCHQIRDGAIVVQFPQPFGFPPNSKASLLLWDCDDRTYSYTVETSVDMKHWLMICDRSHDPCRSWQTIVFPTPAGTDESVGEDVAAVADHDYSTLSSSNFPPSASVIGHPALLSMTRPPTNNNNNNDGQRVVPSMTSSLPSLLGFGQAPAAAGQWPPSFAAGSSAGRQTSPLPPTATNKQSMDVEATSLHKLESAAGQWPSTEAPQKMEPTAGRKWASGRPLVLASFVRITGTQNTANDVFHCVAFICPSSSTDSSSTDNGETMEL